MRNKFKRIYIYLIAIILVGFDQIVKVLIVNNIDKFPIEIIKNLLQFNYCENRGVAFSIGNGNVILFVILNIILITSLIIYYEKNKKEFNKFSTSCILCIIAGGFSNLLDRIFRGYVIDFIDISYLFNFPVFNIADIFIVIGTFGLMFFYTYTLIKESKKIRN